MHSELASVVGQKHLGIASFASYPSFRYNYSSQAARQYRVGRGIGFLYHESDSIHPTWYVFFYVFQIHCNRNPYSHSYSEMACHSEMAYHGDSPYD